MADGYNLTTGSVSLANSGVNSLLFLNPPAAPSLQLKFKRFWVGQSNNMASAQQRIQINTQPTSFPTLTSASPAKLSISDAASILTGGTAGAAGTTGVNASAEGSGTKTVIWADVFNVVNGWLVVLTPEETIEMQAGAASGLGVFFPVAPGTLTSWLGGCNWLEN